MRVEYEGIISLYSSCGSVVHRSEVCSDSAMEVVEVNKEFGGSQDKAMQESGLNVKNSNDGFDAWMAHSFPSSVSGGSTVLATPSFVSIGLEDKDLDVGRSIGTEPTSAVVSRLDVLLGPDGGLRSGLVVRSEGSISVGVPSAKGNRSPLNCKLLRSLDIIAGTVC
ncbi:hypothetical protein JCGZ_19432 [Jatropha curcas]|uniref:Uncharacterized protein n=1 Tax=Jatropha curcas TaxID=180498 RepID=A0A067L7M6_JATCU|nr:hypothetical protein JCGZ_19432 [Jatropha curcas]